MKNKMNWMKKTRWITVLSLVVLMTMLLAGCGNSSGEATDIRVGSLKGPTTMGLVNLMKESEQGTTRNSYTFDMQTDPTVIVGKMVSGELDIACVPANVAAVLSKKVEGGVTVLDINTLGVLYFVSGDETIQTIEDLAGKTVVLTGKGTTPDFALQTLLGAHGLTLDDVTVEYKTEATEVAAYLVGEPMAVGFLPQPFATAALLQNSELVTCMSADEEWAKVMDSRLVTGVTVVRNTFLEEHEAAVKGFLENQKASVEKVSEDLTGTAALIVEYGIIEKEPVAMKAIPNCNITYMDGEAMKTALIGYYETLYALDPTSIGGSIPEDSFYYPGL